MPDTRTNHYRQTKDDLSFQHGTGSDMEANLARSIIIIMITIIIIIIINL